MFGSFAAILPKHDYKIRFLPICFSRTSQFQTLAKTIFKEFVYPTRDVLFSAFSASFPISAKILSIHPYPHTPQIYVTYNYQTNLFACLAAN